MNYSKFKIISINVFCFIFSLCLESKAMQKTDHHHDSAENSYATVSIWNSDITNQIAGHVSLKTDIAYISLWPDSSHETSRSLDQVTPNLSQFFELGFVLDAPAIGMTNYLQDVENENGKQADHSYIVKINTNKINEISIKLLQDEEYKYSEDHNKFILNENYRWYAPGSKESFKNVLDPNKKYLNCASSVVLALLLGGMDSLYFEKMYNFKKLQETGISLLSHFGNQKQESKDIINELSELSKVILPGDVKYILDLKLTDSFEKELSRNFELDTIEVKSISEYLVNKNILKDESESYLSILNRAKLIKNIDDNDYIVFNTEVKEIINQKQQNKKLGEAIMIGTGVVAGAYVISEISKKNDCIIL